MNEELKIWAAGLFDGEGSALIERIRDATYQITVCVASTDPRIGEVIQTNWGGHYRKSRDLSRYNKSSKRLDCTVIFDQDEAGKFLFDIRPYLVSKREEVDIMLRALLVLPQQGKYGTSRKRLPRGSLQLLEPFYEELKSLKSRNNQ